MLGELNIVWMALIPLIGMFLALSISKVNINQKYIQDFPRNYHKLLCPKNTLQIHFLEYKDFQAQNLSQIQHSSDEESFR